MRETVTLAGALVDRMDRLIVMSVATSIGVTPLLHGIFDVIGAAGAPASARIQRRAAGITVNQRAMNQTPLVHSVSLLICVCRGRPDLSAAATARPLHALVAHLRHPDPPRRLPHCGQPAMRGGVISALLANFYLHVLDTSVSRVQQHHTRIERGMGNQVRFADTAPLNTNDQS